MVRMLERFDSIRRLTSSSARFDISGWNSCFHTSKSLAKHVSVWDELLGGSKKNLFNNVTFK